MYASFQNYLDFYATKSYILFHLDSVGFILSRIGEEAKLHKLVMCLYSWLLKHTLEKKEIYHKKDDERNKLYERLFSPMHIGNAKIDIRCTYSHSLILKHIVRRKK